MKKLTTPLLLFGAPHQTPDLRYVTGFDSMDPVVYLQCPRQGYLVVPVMEVCRAARKVKKGICVLSPADLIAQRTLRRNPLHWITALLREKRIRRVCVPSSFPLGLAVGLKRKGFFVRLAPMPVFPQRALKTSGELEKLQQVQCGAVRAMQQAVAQIGQATIRKDGILWLNGDILTAERIRQGIDKVLSEHDCVAEETIVAAGAQGADPHERGTGPLRAREPIVIDIFPRSRIHGYWGDLTRTVVRGRAPPEVRRMFQAVKQAQAVALREIRPAVRLSTVHRKVQRVLVNAGFVTTGRGTGSEGFIHNTGHGLGLAVHEYPILGEGQGRLRVGHVVTVEPGLYYRRHGGVRIEDVVVVTRHGAKPLISCPLWFELKG